MLQYPRAPAEKPAAIIDFRAVHNLGTKVLADKLTIDEILRGCSNPKVEPIGNRSVWIRHEESHSVSFPRFGGRPKACKTLIGGALLNCISVAQKPHHVTRSDDFSLLGRAALLRLCTKSTRRECEGVKILVTGGAGYIGGTVTQLLLDRGHTVVVYDNLCHARRSMVPAGATFVEGDVADSKRLDELFADGSFAGVMHFAALIEAGDSMREPEVYFRNNTAATLSLLEAMVKNNLRKLVFSSTAAVYGEPVSTPITEDAALLPTNAYGESKLLVEQMLAWMHRIHGLRYASLRYFNVAGAIPGRGEAHEPESHLIPLILDVALGRREQYQNLWPGLSHS